MAKHLLYNFQVVAALQQQAGCCVAQVVNPHWTDAGGQTQRLPGPRFVAGLERGADARREDEVRVHPCAGAQPFLQLGTTMRLQFPDDNGGQRHGCGEACLRRLTFDQSAASAAGDGIRLAIPKSLERALDANRASNEVDVLPVKRQRSRTGP